MDDLDRILYKRLKDRFGKGKALVITGARQVGKTTMLKKLLDEQADVLWLNADELPVRERLKEQSLPAILAIIGQYPVVVIDEIQRLENAGLLLKLMVDNFKNVQFIATGSSALEISETVFEPLTGRHFLFHLYPFNLFELYPGKSAFEVERQLDFHLVYGNYPEVCLKRELSAEILTNLANQYLYKDVLVWRDLRKPELLDKMLKLLAYRCGSEVSLHEIGRQLGVKSDTIESYLDLLEKSFVVYRLKAYSNNPCKEISKMAKVYFWDNGVRNALIGNLNPLSNRNDHGQLWENFIISERMKWIAHQGLPIKSYFWRNYNQSEVDYLELENEKLSAYEMKWAKDGSGSVSKAFTNAYPDADTSIRTPRTFTPFCGF